MGGLFLIFVFVLFALNSPIAKAIAARIRADQPALQPGSDQRLDEQMARLDALDSEVARLTEAMDFTQKLLEKPATKAESSDQG